MNYQPGNYLNVDTVFLDLATLEPYDDQWAYLSTLGRISPREAERVARRIGQIQVGAGVERLRPATSTKIAVQVPRTIHAHLRSMITVEAAGLPPSLLASIKHAATMANPIFYERQRRRASTWDTPRYLQNFDETPAGDIVLPRGILERLGDLIEQTGSSLTLTDDRETGTPHHFTLAATLDPEQQTALDAVLPHDLGVLVAPPGSGKTVIACAAAAAQGISTLVLVDRKTLADQWRARIKEHLGIKAGQRGGGRTKTTGVIDVATLQTLARQDDLTELVAGYGLVIVDECHHIPAAAFEHAVEQIPARRWLGITATPYRGDQLDELIALQLGPVRHTITAAPDGTLSARGLNAPRPTPALHVHATDYRYLGDANPSEPGGISTIYKDLAADVGRNQQIVADVVTAHARGRHCLVLTQWVDHMITLDALLRERDLDPVLLRGGTGAKARAAALSRLDPATSDGPLLVVATGSYVGEGFDCPALNTLFLAAPIAFKGRLVQFVGRILRSYPGKTDAEVHDYHDVLTSVLASSLAKRAPGYTSLGFPDPRRIAP